MKNTVHQPLSNIELQTHLHVLGEIINSVPTTNSLSDPEYLQNVRVAVNNYKLEIQFTTDLTIEEKQYLTEEVTSRTNMMEELFLEDESLSYAISTTTSYNSDNTTEVVAWEECKDIECLKNKRKQCIIGALITVGTEAALAIVAVYTGSVVAGIALGVFSLLSLTAIIPCYNKYNKYAELLES